MCLAIPALVPEVLPGDMAKVSLDGVVRTVSIALIDDVQVGDYVVLHVGYALAKIDPEEAARTLDIARRNRGEAASRMKYVDEYRDGALAKGSPRRSRARRGPTASIASWSSAAATPTRSRATASRICCRPTCG